MNNNILPSAIESENYIIGALLIENDAIIEIFDLCIPDYFYEKRNRLIFESMVYLYSKNIDIDILSIFNDLKNKNKIDFVGITYLNEISNNVASASHLQTHLAIIKDKYVRRKLIEHSNKINQLSFDLTTDESELLELSEKGIFEITSGLFTKECFKIQELIELKTKEIIENSKKDSDSINVPTSFTTLDRKLFGFANQDLIIVAARPSMGKTAFVGSIAYNLARFFNKNIGLFSLEMSANQLTNRLILQDCNLDSELLKNGKLSDNDWLEYNKSINYLNQCNIFIDDTSGLSSLKLRSKARRMKIKYNIDLLIVDYLQLMHEPTIKNSREQEISTISRNLKQIAKELKIPVIALSQLNRDLEKRSDKRPQLSDLRESGAIEQDADIVLFIHRPEHYGITEFSDGTSTIGIAEIIIAKNRNGSTGNAILKFDSSKTKFYEETEQLMPF